MVVEVSLTTVTLMDSSFAVKLLDCTMRRGTMRVCVGAMRVSRRCIDMP